METDPDRGLPSATLDPASGELVVDVLLVENASGTIIEGQPLAYGGRLRGDVPVLHAGTGQLLLEAHREASAAIASPPPSGDVACEGSIQILLPGDVLTNSPFEPNRAMVSATLAGADVRGGLWPPQLDCGATRGEDASIAINCSLVGVRRGTTTTAGILRARLAWAGTPVEVPALPGWASELLAAAAPTPGPIATRVPMTWAVSADRPSIVENPAGAGGGNVTIRPEAGTTRYRLDLPVQHRADIADPRQREGMLSVAISGYTGPGEYAADAITGEVTLRGDGTWAEPGDRHYALTACIATLAAASRAENRLECGIDGVPGDEQPDGALGQLSVTWSVESLPPEPGQAVEVTWRFGGHYRSEGWTTVTSATALRPGRYDVPEVRVGGTPEAPEVLRIIIMPFMGDGTYAGEAITATVEGVTGNSPQVRSDIPVLPDEWRPALGECVVTIAGAGGTIDCPGVGASDRRHAYSTTLTATWRALP